MDQMGNARNVQFWNPGMASGFEMSLKKHHRKDGLDLVLIDLSNFSAERIHDIDQIIRQYISKNPSFSSKLMKLGF